MPDGFKVNFDSLTDVVGQMQTLTTKLQEQLETLFAQADKSEVSWVGSARENYDGQKATWRNWANQLNAKMGEIHTASNEINGTMQDMELRNVKIASSMLD